MADVDSILAARKTTHGEYADHARYSQQLKDVMHRAQEERKERGQPALSFMAIEALEMNAHKVARILAGDAEFADHWDDIAGYAKLVSDRLPK